jgi:hypothetical protein
MSRITEAEVAVAVLHILAAQPNGRATVRKLKAELPKYVRLSSADHTDSLTRDHEELWERLHRAAFHVPSLIASINCASGRTVRSAFDAASDSTAGQSIRTVPSSSMT